MELQNKIEDILWRNAGITEAAAALAKFFQDEHEEMTKKLREPLRCPACNNPFKSYHKQHQGKEGIYHTGCYKKIQREKFHFGTPGNAHSECEHDCPEKQETHEAPVIEALFEAELEKAIVPEAQRDLEYAKGWNKGHEEGFVVGKIRAIAEAAEAREGLREAWMKEGRQEVFDKMAHEQRKFHEGFAHPKDCKMCLDNLEITDL